MNYAELIDSEIQAFIAKTNASYPPDAVDLSIQQQREVYDRMCATFRVSYPDGVSATDSEIRYTPATSVAEQAGTQLAIPIRLYTSADTTGRAQIVYFHGGGFIVGGLESHDDVCAELCARTGLSLTAVDYRLAPEYTHPAAFEDALAAYSQIVENSELPVVLIGDSAGATLAAAISHASRDHQSKPLAQILIYPSLGGDATKGSYLEHADAPMLTTKDMDFYHAIVAGDADISRDIRIKPLADTDFSGLPPTMIVSAQCDPLADDGRDYRDRILAAGGEAEWFNEAGLVHGYLRARHSSVRAGASFTRVVETAKCFVDKYA